MWYKNIKAQNFLIFIFSIAGLVSAFYFVNLESEISWEEKHQIEKTVFCELIKYIIEHPDEDPDYFFISVSGLNPSLELMNTFKDMPKVEAVSFSTINFGFSATVTHKSDRSKSGILINLEILDKKLDGTVRVLTSIHQGRNNSATYEYNLRAKEDIYQVISVNYSNTTY
ncbi:MAG: hypothetical protein WD016_10340 [Balneolaceae bacterium]